MRLPRPCHNAPGWSAAGGAGDTTPNFGKMSTSRSRLVGLAIGVAAFVGGYATADWRAGRSATLLPSYRNSAVCRSLQPGVSLRQVVRTLGSPTGAENGYLLFAPSPNGSTIKAKADRASGEVTELVCDSSGAPMWTHRPAGTGRR